MPDITMCLNKDCPDSKSCYRFMAKPNKRWQSYSRFDGPKGSESCRHFAEILEKDLENNPELSRESVYN